MKLKRMVGLIAIGMILTPEMAVIAAPVTDSKVRFSEGEVTGDIVRPDDADGELIVPQPEGEKPTGSLAITYAPSFDFGEKNLNKKRNLFCKKYVVLR